MSRPFRFSFVLPLVICSLAGCRTGTIYDRMYSPKRSYYTPPAEKKEASAEALLDNSNESNRKAPLSPGGALPPAPTVAPAAPDATVAPAAPAAPTTAPQ